MTMTNTFDIDGEFTFEELKALVVVLNEHKDPSVEVVSINKDFKTIEIRYVKTIGNEVENED